MIIDADLRLFVGSQQIKLFVDGDQWCALLGENLQEGWAGFADTPEQAIAELKIEIEKSFTVTSQ